jgi:hypothetical protein
MVSVAPAVARSWGKRGIGLAVCGTALWLLRLSAPHLLGVFFPFALDRIRIVDNPSILGLVSKASHVCGEALVVGVIERLGRSEAIYLPGNRTFLPGFENVANFAT